MSRNRNPRGDSPHEYDPASEALVLMLERHQQQTEELMLRNAASLGAVLLRGARPVPVGTGATLTPTLATGTLTGYTLTNESGAAIKVTFRERDRDGLALWSHLIPAGTTVRDQFGAGGVALTNGLFLDAGGAFTGAIFLRGGDDS